jgi:O-succinylbenzoate synthase
VRASLDGRGGAIPVAQLTADPELLDRWAAPPDRTRWWLDRLDRCADLLPGPASGRMSR